MIFLLALEMLASVFASAAALLIALVMLWFALMGSDDDGLNIRDDGGAGGDKLVVKGSEFGAEVSLVLLVAECEPACHRYYYYRHRHTITRHHKHAHAHVRVNTVSPACAGAPPAHH